MQDRLESHGEQPAVIEVLSAFIRVEAPPNSTSTTPSADVQAALTVLGARDPSYDGVGVVDLAHGHLPGAMLANTHFDRALLTGAQL